MKYHHPSGKPARPSASAVFRYTGLAAAFLVTILLGALSGVLFAYSDDLPEVSALDDYQPSTITRLLSRDGQVVGDFAVERRVVIGYDEMAPTLRQAILASEEFVKKHGLEKNAV